MELGEARRKSLNNKELDLEFSTFFSNKLNSQFVFFPLRSLTAALQDSKQPQPLSKARPEVRSPRVSRVGGRGRLWEDCGLWPPWRGWWGW